MRFFFGEIMVIAQNHSFDVEGDERVIWECFHACLFNETKAFWTFEKYLIDAHAQGET